MVTKTIQRRADPVLLSQVEFTDDPVEYTLRCVLAMAPSLSEALVRQAEEHVRNVFGETPESRRRVIARRNAGIVRDYLAGERLGLLSRRYGLSERRILQIVKT